MNSTVFTDFINKFLTKIIKLLFFNINIYFFILNSFNFIKVDLRSVFSDY